VEPYLPYGKRVTGQEFGGEGKNMSQSLKQEIHVNNSVTTEAKEGLMRKPNTRSLEKEVQKESKSPTAGKKRRFRGHHEEPSLHLNLSIKGGPKGRKG